MEFLPIEKDGFKVYAGFWQRFGFGIIDAIVLMTDFIYSLLFGGHFNYRCNDFCGHIKCALFSVHNLFSLSLWYHIRKDGIKK